MNILSIIGVLLALCVLVYTSMKGWSVFISAPICAIIVAITSRLGIFDTLMNTFMPGTTSFLAKWFLIFMLGSVFGKIMEVSGAAFTISRVLLRLIGSRNAIAAVIISTGVLCYGGVSAGAVVFVVYPVALALFKEADLPKRLLPACIAIGAWGFATAALPGSPQMQNIIPTQYFGTTATAAPVIGVICSVFIFVISLFYMNRRAKAAKLAGEHFVLTEKDESSMNAVNYDDLPGLAVSLLPLVTLIVLIIFLQWEVTRCLAAAVVLSVALYYKRLNGKVRETLNDGAFNSIGASMNTALTVGFTSVVSASAAFSTLVAGLSRLTVGNPYVFECIAVNLLAGITGSASGGISAALATFADTFLATGANPEVLHRIAAISANGLDSMPYCGGVMTMLAVIGVTHKESYWDIFMTTVVFNILGGVLAVILGTLGLC